VESIRTVGFHIRTHNLSGVSQQAMKKISHASLVAALLGTPARAASILFDFDSAPLHSPHSI
jgi:hypothetical protein